MKAFFICNLRTRHAVATRAPLNMGNFIRNSEYQMPLMSRRKSCLIQDFSVPRISKGCFLNNFYWAIFVMGMQFYATYILNVIYIAIINTVTVVMSVATRFRHCLCKIGSSSGTESVKKSYLFCDKRNRLLCLWRRLYLFSERSVEIVTHFCLGHHYNCISQPRRMVMWRETELFIQQNVLLWDLTILFISAFMG
jgi:hypothetical protein